MEMNDLKKRMDLVKLILGVNDDEIVKMGRISSGTFYRIPKGQVSEKQIKYFAENIGVSYDWLMTGEGDHGIPTPITGIPTITTQETEGSVFELVKLVNQLVGRLDKIEEAIMDMRKEKSENDMQKEKNMATLLEIVKPEGNGVIRTTYDINHFHPKSRMEVLLTM